jgi:hypothetical protein
MQRTADSYESKGTWAVLLVAIVLVGAGFAAGRWTAPDPKDPQEAEDKTSTAPSDPVGPRALMQGVPVGYARTEEGALQAALNYSRALSPDPGESKDSYAAKLRAIASDQWGSELQSTIDSWDQGDAETAPLRFRIIEFSDARAEVALWFASFINPRNGSPGAVWGRAFLTLVWEENDWKIAGEDGDAGPWPSPLSGPTAPVEVSELLAGFESIDYEPASIP